MASPDTVRGFHGRWVASAITGLANADPVSSWPASGAGNAAAQATTAKQPTYRTNVLNGQPAVRFDGTDDILIAPMTAPGASEHTVYVVGRRTDAGNNKRWVSFGTTTTNDYEAVGRWMVNGAGPGSVQIYRNLGASTAATIGSAAYRVVTGSWTSASGGTMYVDGTANGTRAVSGAFTFTHMSIGSSPNGNNDFAAIDVLEVLSYSVAHTAGERAEVHSYVQDTYGITVSDYVSSGVTGTGAITAPAATLSGAGTVTTPAVTGTGAVTAPAASMSGTGTSKLNGVGALTAVAASIAAAAAITLSGVGATTGPPSTLAGAGVVTVDGAGALTAPAGGLSGAGTALATGTGDLSAAPATLAGTGDIVGAIGGSGALTAPPAALAGTGTATVNGVGALTTPSPSLTGTGDVAGAVGGTGALAAPPATLTGTGTQALTGTGDLTATPAALAGAGDVIGPAVGTGQLTAPPAGLAGTGALSLAGAGALSVAPPTLAAAGSVFDPSGLRDITITVTSLPDRWATTSLPATITAEATDMHDVHVGSSEYQRVRVTETGGQDITTATLEAAITETVVTPTSGWAAPDAVSRPTVDVADVSVLYTPASQGQRHLWVRVTDNPEVAARRVGSFSVLP